MSKHFGCYKIYKEMILKITEQRKIIIIMRIVWALDFKKEAYELSGPFVKVETPQADYDSSNTPEFFQKNVFFFIFFIQI